jgi:hypothetical protein
MAAIRMMEMPMDDVIDMVSVRNRWMAASRPVFMSSIVTAAVVLRGAKVRILGGDLKLVLIHVFSVRMVEMPIIYVVSVAVVLHCLMATAVPVGMWMGWMHFMLGFHMESSAGPVAFEVPGRQAGDFLA